MFSLSVKMLRRHNPNIPVKLLYVEDAGHDTYVPSLQLSQYIGAEYGNKYLKLEETDIFDLCKELNVDVSKLPPPIQLLNGLRRIDQHHNLTF